MRTTLKRGMGRAATVNGNGRAVMPPAVVEPMRLYKAPEPPHRSGRSTAAKIFGWFLIALIVVVSGLAGGLYLYGHETLNAIAPHTHAVKVAQKDLKTLPTASQPAIALIVGYDQRAGSEGFGLAASRSDTLMLIRADPKNQTISLLSFPRDLQAEIICPGDGDVRPTDQLGLATCGESRGDARHGAQADGRVGQLSDHGQLPRLQAAREQARRRLMRRRPPLPQHASAAPGGYATIDLAARVPEARRPAGARLRPLPAYRLRPSTGSRASSASRGAEGPDGDEPVDLKTPRRDRRAEEQRRDGAAAAPAARRASRRSSRTRASRITWAAAGCSACRSRILDGLRLPERADLRAVVGHPVGRVVVRASRRDTAVARDRGRARPQGEAVKAPKLQRGSITTLVLNGTTVPGLARDTSLPARSAGLHTVQLPPPTLPATHPPRPTTRQSTTTPCSRTRSRPRRRLQSPSARTRSQAPLPAEFATFAQQAGTRS